MSTLTLEQKLLGFQLIAQEKLQAVLCSIPGKKDLIIQSSLIKPLEHICGAHWLKLKGIQRIFKLDDECSNTIQTYNATDQHVQLYVIFSDLLVFQNVVNHIKLIYENLLKSNKLPYADTNLKYFHVMCVPSCFTYFHQVLEQNGLYGIVGLHRFHWDFIRLDDNILSLEIPKVFFSVFVKSDYSFYTSIAESLRIMQLLCGIPDFILTYGVHSENIRKMLDQLEPLPKAKASSIPNNNTFNKWFIIDRDKDYASPLLTPSIYVGLLLEVFQYNSGTIDLQLIKNDNKIIRQKLSLLIPIEQSAKPIEESLNVMPSKDDDCKNDNTQKKNAKKCKLRLNAKHDGIFAENRYKNFTAASQEIRTQVKMISNELQNLNTMKLEEMHDYVNRKLPKITELKSRLLCHLMASETIIEMLAKYVRKIQGIEEDILINTKSNSHINITPLSPRKTILNGIEELLIIEPQRFNSFRLLCLFHICMGLNFDELINFIKTYCNYFGYHNLLTFYKLAKAKLLPEFDSETTENLSIKMATTKILSTLKPAINIATKFQQNQTAATTTFQLDSTFYKLITTSSSVTTGVDDKNNDNLNNNNLASNQNNNNNHYTKPQELFNGIYIPLIAQLCKYCLESSNHFEFISKINRDDINNGIKLNGQPLRYHINQKQHLLKHYASDNSNNVNDNSDYSSADDVNDTKSNLFVYVVGGITYAEIAACHLIGQQYKVHIFVASDSILSGSDVIEQCSL